MQKRVSGRILIVDDEIEICEMLARNFKMLGHSVDTAHNGQEALDKLNEMQFDVVISDIQMPVMDGVTLLKEIRKKFPMVRVIMITGYVTLNNALACMRNKADTCIFKPLTDLTELEDAVTNALSVLCHWNKKFLELHGLKPENNKGEQ